LDWLLQATFFCAENCFGWYHSDDKLLMLIMMSPLPKAAAAALSHLGNSSSRLGLN